MNRDEIHSAAAQCRLRLKAAEDQVNAELQELFGLGCMAFDILFGDVIDHPSMKLSIQQVFNNYRNPDHMCCVEAVIALTKFEDFDRAAASGLVESIRKKDTPEALAVLVGSGVDSDMAFYFLRPLETLLR